MSTFYLHFLTFSIFIHFSFAQISDKRLCVDPECSSPVALGKTLLRYFSPDKYRLSFEPNQDVVIYSKSAGSDESLWGVEINGRRGYIPRDRVKQTKNIQKPTIIVDTEIVNVPSKPQVPLKEEIVNPSKVKQNFEVIDGTTIYMSAGGEDATNNEDSLVENPIHTLDSSKIESPIDNEQSTEEINLTSENPNSIVLQSEESIVVENGEVENVLKSGNLEDKEAGNLVTETAIKSSENVNITQNLTENSGQNNGVQTSDSSSDSQQKEQIDNSNITVLTEGIEKDIVNNKANAESTDKSEDKLQEQEGLKNLFSYVSNAIKPASDSDGNLDQEAVNKEELNGTDMKDDESDSVTLNKSDFEEKKFEPQKQLLDSDILNINEDSNSLIREGSLQNKVMSINSELGIDNTESSEADKVIENSSTSIEDDLQHVLSSISNNFLTEKTDTDENHASQESLTEPEFSSIQSQKEDVNKVESEVGNFSPIDTKNGSSTESMSTENDFYNGQFLKSNMESPSEVSTVESDVPSNTETLSIEIASNSVENPQVLGDIPLKQKEDVNIVLPVTYVENNLGISNDDKASNQNQEQLSANNDNNYFVKETEEHQPTGSDSYFDDNVSREPNNIEDHNILSSDPIDKQGRMNPEVELKNTEGSDIQEDSTEYNKTAEGTDDENIIEKEPSSIFSYFDHVKVGEHSDNEKNGEAVIAEGSIDSNRDEEYNQYLKEGDFCTKEDCPNRIDSKSSENYELSMDLLNFSPDFFIYLVTTAVSVILFLLGHFALDKSRREGPLLVKINKLEKEFLILLKEKELLAEQVENKIQEQDHVDSAEFQNLQQEKEILEEKVQNLEDNIQTLEKELENSTEVGLELNRMLSEILNSENAGQTLMLNIEGLQEQLAEQQGIVSSMKQVLSLKETENHELNLELDIANKKVFDLQCELDKLLSNIIKLEEDKESLEKTTESQMIQFKSTISSLKEQLESTQKEYIKKIEGLNNDLSTSEHNLQIKIKEFEGLKSSMKQIKDIKNGNNIESLLEVNSIKAELEQLKTEYQSQCDRLRKEKDTNSVLEKKVKSTEEQICVIRTKFDDTDKTRLELETKLQVLTNYFKEKEEQLQKELSKYETMWSAKQGEATSTSEKIKYLQSEVQNYKAQNETLKQEIVSQEVELKGQISVLEKKVHENWVSARQAERRLEELKQESAQLRNRLTLRERTLQDDRIHNRMQSPLEQSSDLPISPLHLESPASPPLLYNSRDHITKSPPILGMPLPFLPPPTGSSYLPPPPTGAPYLPPPPLPFMPPPPHDMFPGDHRPPPLGRMSSPPLNSRYSPSRPYSPYDRSPSPSYDESEYGTSPVHRRNYSQFNRRREHRPAAMEKFNGRSGTLSSGSDNSNESLDEINHHNSKV